MSFIGSLGPQGPANSLRFTSTRGRIGNAVSGVNYPSPFFDVAQTYFPPTVKMLFRWCRHYFLTFGIINSTVFKLSEYPITDVVIDHEDSQVVDRWQTILQDQLSVRSFQVETGLDYNTYGNSIASVGFPFEKHLTCNNCGFSEVAKKIQSNWVFTNLAFRLTCPRCHGIGEATPKDIYLKNPNGVRLIRWNVEDIDITYNQLSGDTQYFYNLPGPVRSDIMIGKKDVVCTVPQIYIQAIREKKSLILSAENFYHMKRPAIATMDRGWGTPLLLPVLRDAFQFQIMRKAQEAVLLEHIVPLRLLFPQAASGTSDPFTNVNLVDWKEHVAAEIARWRHDPNYFPVLPLPVGSQTMGGDGRALLLFQEMQNALEQLLMGMGVPRELMMGGLSWSGSNVSLRMMENTFLGYLQDQLKQLRFIIRQISSFLGWPVPKVRFKPFKMADDLQRRTLRLQMQQAGLLSADSMLADDDYDSKLEDARIEKEAKQRQRAIRAQQVAMAEAQGEAQLVLAKWQVKAQQVQQAAMVSGAAPGEPGGPEAGAAGNGPPGAEVPGAGMGQPAIDGPTQEGQSPLSADQRMPANGMQVDLVSYASAQAKMLSTLSPQEQEMAIQNLALQSPELAQLVQQMLAKMGSGGATPAGNGVNPTVDARPLPEQRPPRRLGSSI